MVYEKLYLVIVIVSGDIYVGRVKDGLMDIRYCWIIIGEVI